MSYKSNLKTLYFIAEESAAGHPTPNGSALLWIGQFPTSASTNLAGINWQTPVLKRLSVNQMAVSNRVSRIFFLHKNSFYLSML